MPEISMFASQDPISKHEAKRRLGFDDDIPLLLFFGIVRPYKGLKYAIEAVSILRDKGINVHLVVAGEFWEKINYYEDQISQLSLSGNVTLVNQYIPNEEVANYFTATDIFIAPYIDGTQSASVKIAINFELPIIITRCISDNILDKSRMVRIIPSKDSYELAEAIQNFIINHQEGGKFHHQDKGSWIRQVQSIENLAKLGVHNFNHSIRKQ
jgi:glycosyltransferase involved in cell wall biosynthesis